MYRFVCEQCGLTFEERMSPVEHDQNRAECPRCHSDARVRSARSTGDLALDRRR
ncbi:MAG TPA: zinc ribbon domain-containing protein [Polyangia bacterium]